MMMTQNLTRCLMLAIVTAFGALTYAQHSDIEIEVENGMLVTEPRIGEGEFGEAPNPANVADEPGLEADDGILNAGDVIGFNAVDVLGSHLWHWDGMGAVNFGASPTDLTIEHPVTGDTVLLTSAGSGGAAGYTVGVADADGGMHQDLEFILSDMSAPVGVYLFGMEVTSPSYATSDPLYMVLGSGVSDVELDAAVDWVADTFAIPEPSSWGLCSLAVAAVVALRRQRR